MATCEWYLMSGSGAVTCLCCGQAVSYASLRRDPVKFSDACPNGRRGNPPHVFLSAHNQLECLTCGHTQTQPNVGAVQLTCGVDCSRRAGSAQALIGAMYPPHPLSGLNSVAAGQTPAQVFGAYVPASESPGLGQFCDLKPLPNICAYRCSKCKFEVSYTAYTHEISTRGYYPPRECLSAVATGPGKRCVQCGGEWCEYLDAYHGRDAWSAARCTNCRGRKAS